MPMHVAHACLHMQGFKVGLCNVPPVGVPNSLLCLANNTAITSTFNAMRDRFDKLYKRRWVQDGGWVQRLRTCGISIGLVV